MVFSRTWATATVAALAARGASAASYDTIPNIEVYGQHFFYTNNGSQFYLKGVAYQQNYEPNNTASSNTVYSDPLADSKGCARDIPYLKQIFTNVLRVYAIDPTQNHDDCMAQLASADIYVIADLGEPNLSIESDTPEWNVPLYDRYTAVIDSMAKYGNVIGFIAGNENVLLANQTSAAAFVKAAVRDSKSYLSSQGYRSSLSVGYATADVPSRDDLAAYFACEPGNGGNSTSIDFWGYNVYSWCGLSNYVSSSYDERVQFFSDYPVPVFFAEYGCNQNLPGGPMSRPFTEVPVLYGNMTGVFSGGIVYEWFESANEFGLVALENNGASVSPYPDFTSLQKQLAKVTPTITMKSTYTPSNTPPACPAVGSSWQAQASPLPPPVNPSLCTCMASSLGCNVKSTNANSYGNVFNYICGKNAKYCSGIAHNATSGKYGSYSGCDPQDQLAWVVNQYYNGQNKAADACNFNGLATAQNPTTAATCGALLSAVGTAGTGVPPAATGHNSGTSTGSKAAAASLHVPKAFLHGGIVMNVFVTLALGSFLGMLTL